MSEAPGGGAYFPQALLHVGPVDPGGRDPIRTSPAPGVRTGPARGTQHLGTAGLADLDRGHLGGQRSHEPIVRPRAGAVNDRAEHAAVKRDRAILGDALR